MNENERKKDGVHSESIQGKWSELYKTEDYWAVWLGGLIIACGVLIFFNQAPDGMRATIAESNAAMRQETEEAAFKTIAWYQASDAKAKLKASDSDIGNELSKWLGTPSTWKQNPVKAFVYTPDPDSEAIQTAQEKYVEAQERTQNLLQQARVAENGARAADFENESLNQDAAAAIQEWREAKSTEASFKKRAEVKGYNHLPYMIGLGVFFMVLFGVGTFGMGRSFPRFCQGFVFVFLIAVLAYLFSAQATMKALGIGYAAWAIVFGLMISNTIGTPRWVMPAVQTEYYIKTGLVILGAEILFGKILSIGVPGIFVAWVVTPVVLVSTYWFGQHILKIQSKTLNITVSADMSVCGVSAAIATAAACKAKKEELTLAVGMSLVFTSIMMIVLPNVILALGMDHVLGGAWIGGTVDATGAVAAAGAFLSDKALYVAATIKMIQNILIGLIAFCVALYWCYYVERKAGTDVSAWEIWYRFPKFVIGFIGASIVMSALYQWLGSDVGYTLIDNGVIRGFTKNFRGWFFCLAFVSIGLATDFRELKKYFVGGKPLILYVCGQTLNLILTLIMAYIMFYLIFPDITARI